ncbi:hypothetical protein Tco_0752081 [Tanacetum coccineum]|uniref:Zinc finger, CCHC-type n=1 Tax=Tanacetum coccineum TaxID=301880 RepID=A0ABQ4Z8Z5_9ASTR
MAVAAQNTNNTTIRSILLAKKLTGLNFTNWYRNLRIVLRYEKKIKFMEQPTGPAPNPETADPDTIDKYYETVNLEQEVACLMLSSMSPDLQRTLEKYNAYDMLKELKTMSLLKMKSYLDTLERLGYVMPNELGVSLILNSLNKDYDQFVQNYNMHSIGKTIAELHAMLKLHEKGILKKAETPVVLAIREGKIQKDTKKLQGAKASESHGLLEISGSDKGLEIIQEEDTQPFKNTSKKHNEVAPIEVEPQNVGIPICRSTRIPQAPDRYGYYVDVEEYELGDLDEPPNYKAALVDPESDK